MAVTGGDGLTLEGRMQTGEMRHGPGCLPEEGMGERRGHQPLGTSSECQQPLHSLPPCLPLWPNTHPDVKQEV